MSFRIFKIFFIFLLTSTITVFFVELNNFKENILSFSENNNKQSPNIVILTGGTNRIKDGLKIIEDFKIPKIIKYKILVSGTGIGFTKNSLRKKLGPTFNNHLIQCCVELDRI